MENHMTFGNSSPMATTVAAGINTEWDWTKYTIMTNPPAKEISCPICRGQKSKHQTVCQVCYTNILDSRNGFYPERLSKKEQQPISQ